MTPSLILRDESIRQRAIDRIKALKLDAEEPWAVYVERYRKLRTLEQNAAYWAVVGRICAATGHSKNVIHTYLRKAAWGVELSEIKGKAIGEMDNLARQAGEAITENRGKAYIARTASERPRVRTR